VVVLVALVVSFTCLGGGEEQEAMVGPGISVRAQEPPPLPKGFTLASNWLVFRVKEEPISPVRLGLPLRSGFGQARDLAFYTYQNGRWQRLKEAIVVSTEAFQRGECRPSQGVGQGPLLACGEFLPVPPNLAVLAGRPPQQAKVIASLPSMASLHPEAQELAWMVSPRDFQPSDDGGVKGRLTSLRLRPGQELIPTIWAGEYEAATLRAILSDERLRAAHIEKILSLVKSEGLKGVNIEYDVPPEVAVSFQVFVRELAQGLHRTEAKLAVTLPPPVPSPTVDWAAVGEAADMVWMLPVLDPQSYRVVMPRALEYATARVPPEKLYLVLNPFSVRRHRGGLELIGYEEAMSLALEVDVTSSGPLRPGSSAQLRAVNLVSGGLAWSDDVAAVTFTIGTGGEEVIFVENFFSAGFKLEMVTAFGLAGVVIADASEESDLAPIWPQVREMVETGSPVLQRPNGGALTPRWQASGGRLSREQGASTSWTAPGEGTFQVELVVSDGQNRFGRRVILTVGAALPPSPSPQPSPTVMPTPTPSPTPMPTPTPSPAPSTPTPRPTPTPTPSPTPTPTPRPSPTP